MVLGIGNMYGQGKEKQTQGYLQDMDIPLPSDLYTVHQRDSILASVPRKLDTFAYIGVYRAARKLAEKRKDKASLDTLIDELGYYVAGYYALMINPLRTRYDEKAAEWYSWDIETLGHIIFDDKKLGCLGCIVRKYLSKDIHQSKK